MSGNRLVLGCASGVMCAKPRCGLPGRLFPIELDDVRRYVMNSFPYILRYVLRGDEVWVLTVSHQHRRPDYWVERVERMK